SSTPDQSSTRNLPASKALMFDAEPIAETSTASFGPPMHLTTLTSSPAHARYGMFVVCGSGGPLGFSLPAAAVPTPKMSPPSAATRPTSPKLMRRRIPSPSLQSLGVTTQLPTCVPLTCVPLSFSPRHPLLRRSCLTSPPFRPVTRPGTPSSGTVDVLDRAGA